MEISEIHTQYDIFYHIHECPICFKIYDCGCLIPYQGPNYKICLECEPQNPFPFRPPDIKLRNFILSELKLNEYLVFQKSLNYSLCRILAKLNFEIKRDRVILLELVTIFKIYQKSSELTERLKNFESFYNKKFEIKEG